MIPLSEEIMTRRTCLALSAAALMCGLAVGAAQALDTRPLVGSYAIGSATLVDPPPGERKDRLLLYLDGATAKQVYDAMQAPARVIACDPDLRTKTAGALECSRSKDGEYSCSVGISLLTGATVPASVC
jgi:hypothetical protein